MNHAPLKPLARIFILLGISVGMGACFDEASNSDFSDLNGDVALGGDASAADDPANSGFGQKDASAALPEDMIFGSPLCRVTSSSCRPDPVLVAADGGNGVLGAGELVCSPVLVEDAGTGGGSLNDGGENSSDAGVYLGRACRVRLDENNEPAPSCEPVGSGKDGAACTAGTDCAGGFECVSVSSEIKQCRRYCCSGTCGGKAPETRFCDIAPLANENRLVPVCLPIKPCTLLGNDCAMGETCASVTETGMLSCVPVGKATAGESCDNAHCAEGLNCIGQIGAKKCYQICTMTGSDCASPQICKGNSLFKDEGFGVCQDQ